MRTFEQEFAEEELTDRALLRVASDPEAFEEEAVSEPRRGGEPLSAQTFAIRWTCVIREDKALTGLLSDRYMTIAVARSEAEAIMGRSRDAKLVFAAEAVAR